MKKTLNILFLIAVVPFFIGCSESTERSVEDDVPVRPEYTLVIHGGAGNILKENIPDEKVEEYRAKLTEALQAGSEILKKGGSSLDAVEAAIVIMENSPLFNAGKGAVFNELGQNEMDASIMDGSDLNAGAVASVRRIKNPIRAARSVMEDSKHVLLVRDGAEKFAVEQGVEMADTSYFFDASRWDYYQKVIAREKHGTVGAVALDMQGNLAAGTSTGGMTNKMLGRVGDSPIIGAGTYANNLSCAISATGHGEFFIRNVVAYDVSALMLYKNLSLEEACNLVIQQKLKSIGAEGGIIALDKDGNIDMEFNTAGMFRGYIRPGEAAVVEMFEEEI